ncbi:G-type lectin S-receptor-like serine/threonine-protein kinase RKS1 isoform X2 [Manihot esculenta]|uniref:Uncharacterized protein n=1 Tax=Manihot esculenta TaxID=3983 RepID=A0ACB7FWS8_MANES|nr:G-type lectin S-receptor-like serine/threonine-protein kinase RKS1 isoform X2 [Manihot esculenta]KAG8612180.1 hypothetical protein MANES_S095212v8 [Manihot esculenta]
MGFEKLFLQSFLFILHLVFCSSKDTLTINQTIQDGDLIISKGNSFALGFFSPASSKFRYLGIWFNQVKLQTVVWIANRNNPINGSSGVLSIDPYGNLVLHSNQDMRFSVWSTNITMKVTDTCVAQLLDSGNLVLFEDRSKTILWQSFDYPTDTHLPGLKIGLNQRTGLSRSLSSWRSQDDPATGDYLVEIDPTGSPQVFLSKGTTRYWRSMPWPLKGYADSVNFTFINNEYEIFTSFSIIDASVITRVVLDYSGAILHQIWHEKDGEWKNCWSGPKYQCDTYAHCGTNAKCNPHRLNLRFECDCLPGYEPKSPRDWNILKDASGGCVRKRLESSSLCGSGEGFVKLEDVKVPDTSVAVWVAMNMSPIDCEKECKRNCSCTAYASIDILESGTTGCLAWFGGLIDVVEFVDEGYDLYVRVDSLELAEIKRQSMGFLERKDTQAILVVSVVSAWFIIIIFAYLWHKRKKRRERNKWNESLLHKIGDSYYHKETIVANEVGDSMSYPHIAFFDMGMMLAATNNFSPSNKLGQGGFGLVYKEVAIKKLSKSSRQGIEEFKNEVMLIAKLQHKNLVKLLGCCIQGEEPMLVYEYMPNKSLDSLLFDERNMSILDWRKRFDIIVGIARGILYLHQDSRLKIIHRDLKSSNILLDGNMNPKISDFGMARIFKIDQIQEEKTRRVVGTFGYMSPEYVVFGKFSEKSDIFSFGVILLEIITGKKNNSFHQEGSCLTLIGHVWNLWKEERALEIVDPLVKDSNFSHEVLRCIQIGLLCVQENAKDRPTILAIVLMLNSESILPSPNEPAFILKKCNSKTKELYSVNELTISNITSR